MKCTNCVHIETCKFAEGMMAADKFAEEIYKGLPHIPGGCLFKVGAEQELNVPEFLSSPKRWYPQRDAAMTGK